MGATGSFLRFASEIARRGLLPRRTMIGLAPSNARTRIQTMPWGRAEAGVVVVLHAGDSNDTAWAVNGETFAAPGGEIFAGDAPRERFVATDRYADVTVTVFQASDVVGWRARALAWQKNVGDPRAANLAKVYAYQAAEKVLQQATEPGIYILPPLPDYYEGIVRVIGPIDIAAIRAELARGGLVFSRDREASWPSTETISPEQALRMWRQTSCVRADHPNAER